MKKKASKFDKTDGLWPFDNVFGQTLPHTDPLGSYTGTPEDPYERPVQDADDL